MNLILTAAVIVTVFLALVLAQFDALQARMLPQRSGLPIVNMQATAVAVGQVIPLLEAPPAAPGVAAPVADDLNPRPEFITGITATGDIATVCGEVPGGWLLYTVPPGETLASLAAATGATTGELMAANCLADGQLTAGMQLLVPRQPAAALCGPPQWWVRYQVQPGDTLGALARARGTTVDEILRANCRDTTDLLAGQLIFLPPGFAPGPAAPLPQPSLTPLPPTLPPTVTATPPTAEPQPTDTPTAPPTFVATDTPRPTGTPTDTPTDTPEAPTDTPEPPTDTPEPPTDTPEPPTDTPEPPTDTPEPPTITPPPPPTEPPPTDPPPPTEEPTSIPNTPDPPDEDGP